MFNQLELEAYYERNQINYEAQQVINHIRRSEPSRRTRSGMYNVACRYPSKKMKCTIQAESHHNELAAVYEWDHDCVTNEFYDQPPKIKLSYQKQDDKRVTILHTPDYFILADDYTGWIECKTEEHLIKLSVSQPERYIKDVDGNWRCPPGETYAAQYGLQYSLRSSSANDWTLLRNLVFLSNYLDADCPAPTEAELTIAKGLFEHQPWMNLIDLVRADEALSADAIYKMIVDGDLYFPVRSNPIAEIEYAVIYRDEVSADFYRLHSSKSATTDFDLRQPIQIQAGEKLSWDGTSWKIDNVGKELVYLSSADGHRTHIAFDALQTYIQDGAITGLPVHFSQELANHAHEKICATAPADMQIAVTRYNLLHEPENTSVHKSPSSIKNYRRKYLEAEQLYGNGLIGLIPQIKKRGNRTRKLDQEVIDLMEAVIQEKYLLPTQPKLMSVYGELQLQCKEKGLLAPSEKTFRTAIHLMDQYEVVLARQGKRAAYEHEVFYWRIDMETPRHGERPFDIAHIDHTQLDIQLGDRRFGIFYERPWLSVMLDAYSRKVLAFWISFDSPSFVSCMMLIKRCIQQHGRIPRVLVFDGGAEFDSEYLETLMAYLGTTKKSRAKSKARFGSVLERFFGTTNTQLIHNLSGNTQATKTPRTCTPSHDPKAHVAWTLESFTNCFANWLAQVYESNPHKSLGASPAHVFAVGMHDFGMRAHKHLAYTREFELLCLPSTKTGLAKVNSVKGIHLNYQSYWCPEFNDPSLSGKRVSVKFDPDNCAKAYAYVHGRWIECMGEFAVALSNRSVKQIELISNELKAKHKLMGKKQKVTAMAIAEFIREANITEHTQRQMWRDQEQYERAVFEQPQIAHSAAEIEVTDVDTDDDDDETLEVYGDF